MAINLKQDGGAGDGLTNTTLNNMYSMDFNPISVVCCPVVNKVVGYPFISIV